MASRKCLKILFAQIKKTRWKYFQTWASNPPDFLKRSSCVTLFTVKLKSAAAPPCWTLLLLLPGSGARQGRAACLHDWEPLLQENDVSSGYFSRLAQCVCVAEVSATVFLHQQLDFLKLVLVWSYWVNLIKSSQMLTTSKCVQLMYLSPCVPLFLPCLLQFICKYCWPA